MIDNPTDAKPHAKVITVKDVTGEGNVRKYERIETTDRISITEFDGEGLISKEFSKYIDTQLCGRHTVQGQPRRAAGRDIKRRTLHLREASA